MAVWSDLQVSDNFGSIILILALNFEEFDQYILQ